MLLLTELVPLLVLLLLDSLTEPWLLLSRTTNFPLDFLSPDVEGMEAGNGFAPLVLMQLATGGLLITDDLLVTDDLPVTDSLLGTGSLLLTVEGNGGVVLLGGTTGLPPLSCDN